MSPAQTITATCGGETATQVVFIPDLTGGLTTIVSGTTVTGTVSGLSDDTSVTVDWGDGTTPDTGIPVSGGAGSVGPHVYDEAGTYTITVTGEQTGAVITGTVTIAASPMTVTTDTTGDPEVVYTVSGIDAGDGTVTVDFGDGSGPQTVTVVDGTASVSHTYDSGGDYTFTVTGDTTGYTSSETVTVTGPEMTAAAAGDPDVTLDVSNIDPADTTVTVDWGDS